MKRLLLTGLLILTLSSLALASSVTVVWDPLAEPDLAGYRLYQSSTSGDYTFGADTAIAEIPAGTETYTIPDIADGEYYWVLTAFDTSGNESTPSNEATAIIDTTAPNPPQITITVWR